MLKDILNVLILSFLISWAPVIAYLIIRCSICYFRKEDDKVFETKKEKIIVYLLCFLLSISYVTMKKYWGTNTIGSFFSKSEFNTQYYVHIFPEGSESKNYFLPADLYIQGKSIAVEKIYWPTGGYSSFSDYDNFDTEGFYSEGIIRLTDNQGRKWTIFLTDKKVNH